VKIPDFEIRCERCNVPHARHPDSNKHGGLGYILDWRGGLCPVCESYYQEYPDRKDNQQLSDYE